eukprot:1276239-Amphidinium_carterae.1
MRHDTPCRVAASTGQRGFAVAAYDATVFRRAFLLLMQQRPDPELILAFSLSKEGTVATEIITIAIPSN